MVSSSGLPPLFRAVLKGRFVFWEGRGGVNGFFLKIRVNYLLVDRGPSAGGLGEGFSPGKMENYR